MSPSDGELELERRIVSRETILGGEVLGPGLGAEDARHGGQPLEKYTQLLVRYHRTLDLMSDRGLSDLDRHLQEAMRYAEMIKRVAGESPTVVDVGSGAGLPGVVIAIMLPAARVLLVERRRRRRAFLELVSGALGLDNVDVVPGDVLDLSGVAADVVSAQAVAAMSEVVRLTRHLHADPCYLIGRRGEGWRHDLVEVWRAAGLAVTIDQSTENQVVDAPFAEGLPGDGLEEPDDAKAEAVPAGAELFEEPLEHRGSLVALRLPGGSACQSSA